MGCELLDLSEQLRVHRVVTSLFDGPLVTQIHPGPGQSQELFLLCDGHLEILSDPLLAGELRQSLERTHV